MINPYETLNLPKDCNIEQIKKAYKNMAKIHHPDTGGESEQFALIKLAYDTLKDKKKRKDYDDYGVIDDKVTLSADEVASSRLRQVFNIILDKCPIDQLESIDVVSMMKIEVTTAVESISISLSVAKRGNDNLKKALCVMEKRLKRKGVQSNFLTDLVKHKITESNQQIFQIEKELGICQDMLNILHEFSYDFEVGRDVYSGNMNNPFLRINPAY